MKPLPTSPKGFLFDLGGTVLKECGYDIAAGRRRIMELAQSPRPVTLTEYNLVADELHAALDPQRDIWLVEFPCVWFSRLVCDRLGIRFDRSDDEIELAFWQASTCMEPAPSIHAALDVLKAQGLPLGIVSNSTFSGKVLSWELARHGLLDYFAFVMSSADYGLRKPHPMLFKTAAGKLGLNPWDIAFIGDSLKYDVAGASQAGMTAIWYNPHGLPAEDVHPDADLRDWAELGRLVGR